MKKFSKLFWVALVVVAVLACTAIGVFAAETASTAVVYGESVEATDSFGVDFAFKNNNTKVECGKITLTWDSNAMTATSVVAADALNGAQFGSKIEEGKAVIAWAGSAIDAEDAEGVLFTVNFTKKAIAADGYATVDVAVDNFGYTEGFVAFDKAETVTAKKAFATGADFEDMTYDANTTKTPAEFFEDALAIAAETGKDVNILVASKMVFTADATIGENTYNENAGTVNVSATLGEDGKPTTGILVYADVIVNIYGKMNFNNIQIGTTQYVYGYTPSTTVEGYDKESGKRNTYSSGGCLEFVEGLGTFGLTENQGTAEEPDFGCIETTVDDNAVAKKDGAIVSQPTAYRAHLAGHVRVYDGFYYTISGNYNKSGVEINNPDVYVGGTTNVYYVMGGAHNGTNETNPVTGTITLTIEGYAQVVDASVGSWYSATNQIGGSGTVGGNATVSNMTAGFVGSGTIAEGKKYTFTITSDDVVIDVLSGHRFNAAGQAETNVEMALSQGKIEKIFAGFSAEWNYDPDNDAAKNQLSGKTKVEITSLISVSDSTKPTDVYGGSQMRHKGDIHNAETTLVVSGVQGEDQKNSMVFNGGSQMLLLSQNNTKGIDYRYTSNSTGSTHSGKTTMTFTDCKLTNTQSIWSVVYGGSTISSASTHSGEVEITLDNFHGDKRVVGGSYLAASGAEHSGKSTVTVKAAPSTFTQQVMGGSICYSANTTHSGNSKVIIDYPEKTQFYFVPFGGSYLNNTGAKHSGTSEVALYGGYTNNNIYGGSNMGYPRTTQTGDSKVSLESKYGSEYASPRANVYGGSNSAAFLIADNPDTTDKVETHYPLPTDESEKGAYGHHANSSVVLGSNGYHQNNYIFGGSNLNYTTEWIKQGYIIQGDMNKEYKTSVENTGTRLYRSNVFGSADLRKGGYQYADSEVNITTSKTICVQRIAGAYLDNGAELVGDCSVKFDHKNTTIVLDSATKSLQFVLAGGAYGSGKLTGDSSLEIKGSSAQIDFHGSGAPDLTGSVELVGGCLFTTEDSIMTGDSSLVLDGLDVDARTKGYNSSTKKTESTLKVYVTRRVIGGCYGPGKMTGNSTLKLLSDTQLNWAQGPNSSLFEAIVTAGCYGTNDITTEKDATTGIYGGIRQTGNVEFISNTSGVIDSHNAISGIKSNVDGNLTIRLSGTGTYTQNFSALGRDYYYSSITGDLKTYVSNGTFNYSFYNGGTGKYDSDVTPKIRITGDMGYNIIGGTAYLEISGGTFGAKSTSTGIFTTGQLGACGDSYLKFVGDAFNIQNLKYIYSADWSDSLQAKPQSGARDILDLSLVTDLALDYTNFTRVATEGDTLPTLGNSSERGFSVVYPALADASTISVTLANREVYPGAVLEDDDAIAITYATDVTAHSGTSAGSVTTNAFSGTIAQLCEFDSWADSKTINAFKYVDAATSEEFTDVPASPVGFTTTSMIVKAGNASSESVAVRHGLRMSGATLTLESDLSIKVKYKPDVLNYYTDVKLIAIDENGVERVVDTAVLNTTENVYDFAYKNISPQMAGDLFNFKIRATYGEETVETAVTSYGIITYCNSMLNKSSTSTTLKTLIVDLLNYAATAQVYNNYKSETLVNANLTDEQKAYASTEMEQVINEQQLDYKVVENATITWKGAALTLKEKIDLKVVIQVPEGVDVKTLTMKVVVGDKEPVYVPCSDELEGSYTDRYAQRFDQLKPYELRTPILLTILDSDGNEISNTVKYSAASYVYSNPVKGSESLKALVEAMIMYGDSTKEQIG